MSESIYSSLSPDDRSRMAGKLLAVAALRVAANQEKDKIETDNYENEIEETSEENLQ